MALPTLTKTWSFSNNNRISFVSLNDTMARFLFGIKNFLVATMGYTVKYTCNGTTGPSSPADNTDRWTSFSNCTTRGANSTSAQSFAVLTDGNGVDILLAYQGAGGDDVCKLAFSQGALYTPAATATNQPTATDEVAVLGAGNPSVINATASLDRVWSIQATTDKKMFRVFMYRSSVMTYQFGVELVSKDPSVLASFNWTPPVVGWATPTSTPTGNGTAFGGTTANQAALARITGNTVTLFGTGESRGWDLVGVAQPELQAYTPIVNIGNASTTANYGGRLCDRIDMWGCPVGGQLGQGDTFGSLQFAYLGSYIVPWDGTTTPVIA